MESAAESRFVSDATGASVQAGSSEKVVLIKEFELMTGRGRAVVIKKTTMTVGKLTT